MKKIKVTTDAADYVKANADLAEQLQSVGDAWKKCRGELDVLRIDVRKAEARAAEAEKQFADLKERLHNAETENARMRGYLDRVREDDGVREELVATGDPNGEQALVPKRKHVQFQIRQQVYDSDGAFVGRDMGGLDRRKPKHWVNY